MTLKTVISIPCIVVWLWGQDIVKSITISPTVQSDLVELSIQDFVEYCKFDVKDFSEFIKHSKVPVRF